MNGKLFEEEEVEGAEFELFLFFIFYFLFLFFYCFMMIFDFGSCCCFYESWSMKRKLNGGTHTGEVYLTAALEWQGAGSGGWLGRKEMELETMIRVGLGL